MPETAQGRASLVLAENPFRGGGFSKVHHVLFLVSATPFSFLQAKPFGSRRSFRLGSGKCICSAPRAARVGYAAALAP